MVGGPLESVTIRDEVMPRLQLAGWSADRWEQEYRIAPGQLTVVDRHVRRDMPVRAALALLHDHHPVAVVEAKRSLRSEYSGNS